jgi:pimeloyl-ACP methyl ester carboxylesterase
MKVAFIDVDGMSTRCIFGGAERGRPILLIHGLTLIADIWAPHIAALEEHGFRVIAPDMAGSGFTDSPPSDGRPMIAHKVDHLCRLLDVLGIRDLSISGSSYGALIAALLYLRKPSRVQKLVINGSGSCFNSPEEVAASMRRTYADSLPSLGASTPDEWRKRVARSFYDKSIPTPALVSLLMTCYARNGAIEAWERTIHDMLEPSTFRRFSILERLAEFNVPTLVLWGRQDPGAPYANAVACVPRMPRATLTAFDQCGHLPMLEHPHEYSKAVLDFLGQHSRPQPTTAAT